MIFIFFTDTSWVGTRAIWKLSGSSAYVPPRRDHRPLPGGGSQRGGEDVNRPTLLADVSLANHVDRSTRTGESLCTSGRCERGFPLFAARRECLKRKTMGMESQLTFKGWLAGIPAWVEKGRVWEFPSSSFLPRFVVSFIM